MGMSYEYAGSASYPRFDEEVCAVAAVFGGVKTNDLEQREKAAKAAPKGSINWWFGFYISDDQNKQRFIFPNGANETITKWLNNIYEPRTVEETKEIWKHICVRHEIKDISRQIWYEIRERYLRNEGWKICQ